LTSSSALQWAPSNGLGDYVIRRTYTNYTNQSMTNRLALLGHWSVRQKLSRASSLQFSYVALYAPLNFTERSGDCLVAERCLQRALIKSIS